MEIVWDGKIIRVLVTHFGLALNERRRQAQALVRILRQQKANYALTLVIGDINEWRPRGFALYSLNNHLGKAPARRTFSFFFSGVCPRPYLGEAQGGTLTNQNSQQWFGKNRLTIFQCWRPSTSECYFSPYPDVATRLGARVRHFL